MQSVEGAPRVCGPGARANSIGLPGLALAARLSVFAHRGAQRIQQALIYYTTGLPGGRLLRFLATLITTAAALGLLYVLAV